MFPRIQQSPPGRFESGMFWFAVGTLDPHRIPLQLQLDQTKKGVRGHPGQWDSEQAVRARENNLTLFFCAVHSRVQTGIESFQHASCLKEIHTMRCYLVVPLFFFFLKSLHHMWHSKPGFLLLLCQFCPCFCKSASSEWTPAQHDTSSLSSYISQPIDLRHATVCVCLCVSWSLIFPYHFIA